MRGIAKKGAKRLEELCIESASKALNILAIGITKGFPAFTNQFVERPRVAQIFPLRFATWPNNVNGVAKISLALLLGLRGTKIVVCDEFQQGGILRKRSAHLIDRDVL